MTKIRTSIVIGISLLILSMVFIGSAAAQTATRTVPSECVNEGEIFTITIDPPAAGVVFEALCDGWTYVDSSLDDYQVEVTGNQVTFALIDGNSFTYRVQAPSSPGDCCTIIGVYMDMDQTSLPMDDDTVCTCGETPTSQDTATRTVPSDCITAGEMVTITIAPPAAGVVFETLCDGWTYVDSSLDDYQVDVTGNQVTFTVVDGSSFTYRVMSPSSLDECCTITGVYMDMDQTSLPMEDDTVCTCSDTTGGQEVVIRTVPSECVNEGEIITITIDPPAAGVVFEALCDGWTYVDSSLDDYQVDVTGNQVAFVLVDGSSFTYRVQVPDSTGSCCDISGTYRDMDGINHLIEDDTICVCTPPASVEEGIPLCEGWNIFSVPGVLENDTIEYVLEGVEEVEAIIWYDASTQNWIVPTDITPLTAYAIKVNTSGVIMNLGYMPNVPPSRQMYEGWNLVGLTGMVQKTAEFTFNVGGIDDNYSKVWGPWDCENSIYTYHGYNMNVDDPIGSESGPDVYTENYMMNPYEGHWIKMTDDAMLEAIG